jgi:hypothetical protein
VIEAELQGDTGCCWSGSESALKTCRAVKSGEVNCCCGAGMVVTLRAAWVGPSRGCWSANSALSAGPEPEGALLLG